MVYRLNAASMKENGLTFKTKMIKSSVHRAEILLEGI